MELFYWYNILIILGMFLSIPYFFVGDIENRRKHLVIFLILLFISLVEILGKYKQLLGQNNTLIYNVG
ncbi:hypothetical protein [Aquiflexum sp.]|uniref:hypothetical protein n=1 Tax=Aquiflexum sp. TaxID=1872584 RepID=UPI0035935F02